MAVEGSSSTFDFGNQLADRLLFFAKTMGHLGLDHSFLRIACCSKALGRVQCYLMAFMPNR